MDRRTAVAVSVSLLATVAVGTLAFAALGGVDVLGFGSQPDSVPVEIVETAPSSTAVGDTTVAVTTTTLVGEVPGTTIDPAAATGDGAVSTPGATTPRSTTPGATSPATAPAATSRAATTPPVTVAPTAPATAAPTTVAVPRTTVAPATTAAPPASTLPAGVPKDWPAGVPIPPKPPGCVDGQLEDNGVWNCQH